MRSEHWLRGKSVVLGLLLAATVWMLPSAASAALPVDQGVVAAFDDLDAYINGIPDSVLNQGQRQSFLAKLNNARKKYVGGDICTAENVMGAFLNEASAFRKGSLVAIAEDLRNRGTGLVESFFDVFFDDPGLARPRCFDAKLRQAPQVVIGASDNTQFVATIGFGSPRFSTVQAGGETWTQVSLPAVQSQIGAPGMPALPSWQALVAIPKDSIPVLARGGIPAIRETVQLNLFPFQRQPVDQVSEEDNPDPLTFADKPFVKDSEAYATNAFHPPNPCAVRILGSMRDLQLAQVQCVAGQYNPVTDEMRLFDSVQFEVQFQGGDGSFVTSQSLNPFEKASQAGMSSPLNYAVLGQYVKAIDISKLPCLGEELLILTHPDFRAASDVLAQWKRDKGISTTVIDVGPGTPYTTATLIDELIQDRYDKCVTRLSYVLLVGDSEKVPPSRTNYDTTSEPDSTTGSDWNYATYPHIQLLFLDALFPYFSVGRIPVDTATEAQTVVDKIVQYESSPPFTGFGSGGPFYTTASVASQFQCCRMNQ
ncbi:MAG: C25 family cysteine peptidase, partial [Gammaproteobacteria bacterium]|nr:C25 family cysteine peptidase [Gammaproteobacteria bacterium]